MKISNNFWATVCKTMHPMLSDRCPACLSCLSVKLVYCGQTVGWMDQDETWHGGRPRPGHIRWGPSCPPKGHSPQFSAHVCCVKTVGSIKMPLGTEVDLGTGHIVLDGDPAPPKGRISAPSFRPTSTVEKRSPISATAELV